MTKKFFKIDNTYFEGVSQYNRKDAIIAIIIYLVIMMAYYIMGLIYMKKGLYIGIEVNVGLAILCFLAIKLRKQSLSSIGFTKRNFKKSMLLGLILGLIVLIANNLGNVIGGNEIRSLSILMEKFVYFLLVIALVEEIIFRGYLQTRIYGIIKKRIPSILIISFLFMIMHIPFQMGYANMNFITYIANNWITLCFTFLWHIIFNFLYMKYNSIIAPTIFHGFLDWSNYIF